MIDSQELKSLLNKLKDNCQDEELLKQVETKLKNQEKYQIQNEKFKINSKENEQEYYFFRTPEKNQKKEEIYDVVIDCNSFSGLITEGWPVLKKENGNFPNEKDQLLIVSCYGNFKKGKS